MDKLVEREAAPRTGPLVTPALAVQFFLIPLAVVGVVVAIYAGFRMLMADERTVEDYLLELQTTRGPRRWPPAFELSRRLADPDVPRRRPGIGRALLQAYKDSETDDPRVRRYLALAIGRLEHPPAGAVQTLIDSIGSADPETRISVIWALGALGDASAVPTIQQLYASDDPGIRKVVVYALGALPGAAQRDTLRTALNDPAPDVQWNAAVALAEDGDAEGVPVLRRMLDRGYVRKVVTRTADPNASIDPASDVMISALRAAARLKVDELREPVVTLSRRDENLKVRQAAIEALREWKKERSAS
jgi:HEAT repeat protein